MSAVLPHGSVHMRGLDARGPCVCALFSRGDGNRADPKIGNIALYLVRYA